MHITTPLFQAFPWQKHQTTGLPGLPKLPNSFWQPNLGHAFSHSVCSTEAFHHHHLYHLSLNHFLTPSSKPILSTNPFHHRLLVSTNCLHALYLNPFFCSLKHLQFFLVFFLSSLFFGATCSRLSWFSVNFSVHINIAHHIISYCDSKRCIFKDNWAVVISEHRVL